MPTRSDILIWLGLQREVELVRSRHLPI